MVGITLSPEQIRNAPPEVRSWLEQELFGSLGMQPPAAAPSAPHLVACGIEQVAQVLYLIQPMIPVAHVFFELGRAGTGFGAHGLVAFRLADIMRHTRLQSVQHVLSCLDTINEAVRRVRGDANAVFYGLDDRGFCLVPELTQRSISQLWQDILAKRDRPANPTAPDLREAKSALSMPAVDSFGYSFPIGGPASSPREGANASADGSLADAASPGVT